MPHVIYRYYGALTDRDRLILAEIRRHHKVHGYAPTVRELGRAAGLSSSCTIQAHLDRLRDDGYITKRPWSARTITLTAKGRQALYADGDALCPTTQSNGNGTTEGD